jgi:serine/threonine protein kinase
LQLVRLAGLAANRALWQAVDLRSGERLALWMGTPGVGFSCPRLLHDGLCTAVQYGVLADGAPWQAQPWVDGVDLSQFAGEPQSADAVAWVGLQVVQALAALHDGGWAHGHLTASQVRVALGDRQAMHIVVVGLHEAQLLPVDGLSRSVSTDGRAVGALLYQLLSGHPPLAPDDADGRSSSRLPAAAPRTLRRVISSLLETGDGAAAPWDPIARLLARVLILHERDALLGGWPRRPLLSSRPRL